MAVTSREELKEYALRSLGAPVIEINVDDDQLEDRIDEALETYFEYHSDGLVKIYLKHPITAENITNGWIPISEDVVYISHLFPITTSSAGTGMFSVKYQMMLNDMSFMAGHQGADLAYFDQMQQYLSLLDMKLNGHPQTNFSRRQNRLYIHGLIEGDVNVGSYLIAETFEKIDVEEFAEIWNEIWLKKYTTQLFKRQWGNNLSKFEGMVLPGGVTMNGYQIMQDANAAIEALEEELRSTHELPIDFFIG